MIHAQLERISQLEAHASEQDALLKKYQSKFEKVKQAFESHDLDNSEQQAHLKKTISSLQSQN